MYVDYEISTIYIVEFNKASQLAVRGSKVI